METERQTGGRWHRVYPACLDCGGTEKRHAARGLCTTCINQANKPGYAGHAAPSARDMNAGGRLASQKARDEIAARAVAAARARGWRPQSEREAGGEMKGWAGQYHACRDCGSDRRPHSQDGYCTLCFMERSGHTPTALEASLIDGAEPPLARAAGTTLPPDAPAPPARILPARRAPEPHGDSASGAVVLRVHADAMERARARHQATFSPDATAHAEVAIPLPEPEMPEWESARNPPIPEDSPLEEAVVSTCGNTWRYDSGNVGPPCVLPVGHEGLHSDGGIFLWEGQLAPDALTNGVVASPIEVAEDMVAQVITGGDDTNAPPDVAPPHLGREEIEPGESLAAAPRPPVPPATERIALADVPTDALVAELQRRREATRRAYEAALSAMESLDLALDALSAPTTAPALGGAR